jgi:hypothetical protein
MMIKHQSTILFAAALSTTMASDSTLLRGGSRRNTNIDSDNNNSNDKHQEVRRKLLQLGDMACEEDTVNDGSIVCSFRIVPPTNTISGAILDDCLSVSGTDLCLNADISIGPLGGAEPQPPAYVFGEVHSVNVQSNSATVPSPEASSNPPPQNPSVTFSSSTQESVLTINNANPGCPPQNQVPRSGDSCNYSGRYYACDYFEQELNGARTQCRCNHDGLFYCRGVTNNLFN